MTCVVENVKRVYCFAEGDELPQRKGVLVHVDNDDGRGETAAHAKAETNIVCVVCVRGRGGGSKYNNM